MSRLERILEFREKIKHVWEIDQYNVEVSTESVRVGGRVYIKRSTLRELIEIADKLGLAYVVDFEDRVVRFF